jgi:hypothetical protein
MSKVTVCSIEFPEWKITYSSSWLIQSSRVLLKCHNVFTGVRRWTLSWDSWVHHRYILKLSCHFFSNFSTRIVYMYLSSVPCVLRAISCKYPSNIMKDTYLDTEQLCVAVTPYTFIQEVPVSNVSQNTVLPKSLLWFSSVPQKKKAWTYLLSDDRFLPNPSQFIIHYYPTICRYIVCRRYWQLRKITPQNNYELHADTHWLRRKDAQRHKHTSAKTWHWWETFSS